MWNKNLLKTDDDLWWLSFKVSMIGILCFFLLYILFTRFSQPFPSGICQYVDCAYFVSFPLKYIIAGMLLVATCFYVLEKWMLLSTLTLSIISICIFSLEESNGNTAENGILSFVFIAQFLAYTFKKLFTNFNVTFYRIQFPAQAFAAIYTLSAISKLEASGIDWFMDSSPRFSLEVLRFYYGEYVTHGFIGFIEKGNAIAAFVLGNPLIIKILLGLTLLIELCSFLLIVNVKISRVYALLLLAMHIGIYILLNIFFPTIILPLIVLFINPLFYPLQYVTSILRNRQKS